LHTAVHALQVEHITCLLDTEKVENLSQLTRDLPVKPQSLFGDCCLMDRIVELARMARDYTSFAGVMSDLGMSKPRFIKAHLQGFHPFGARRLRGALQRHRGYQNCSNTSSRKRHRGRGGDSSCGSDRQDKIAAEEAKIARGANKVTNRRSPPRSPSLAGRNYSNSACQLPPAQLVEVPQSPGAFPQPRAWDGLQECATVLGQHGGELAHALLSLDGPHACRTVLRWGLGEGPVPVQIPVSLSQGLPQSDLHCLKKELPMTGRLAYFLLFWQKITKDAWVLDTI